MNQSTKQIGKQLLSSVFDIKELLKGEQAKIDQEEKFDPTRKQTNAAAGLLSATTINVESIFGLSSKYKIQRALHPQIQYKRNYIILDSKNRVPSTNLQKMQWLYLSDATFQQGTVNTKGQVRDLIGMRIYPVRAAQNYGLSAAYSPTYTFLIEEFQAQSFIGHQKRNYHFMMRQTITPAVPPALPVQAPQEMLPMNDGYFWFRKPITSINTLTISMANPLVVINMPVSLQVAYSQYFTYASPTVIALPYSTGYTTGDTVVISNFTTADPVTDAAIITAMNSPNGFTITVLDANTFSIPIDTSTITPLTTFQPFYLTNENLRVIIPLELIYIAPDDDTIDA